MPCISSYKQLKLHSVWPVIKSLEQKSMISSKSVSSNCSAIPSVFFLHDKVVGKKEIIIENLKYYKNYDYLYCYAYFTRDWMLNNAHAKWVQIQEYAIFHISPLVSKKLN